jgi:hypothetical protein
MLPLPSQDLPSADPLQKKWNVVAGRDPLSPAVTVADRAKWRLKRAR